MKVFNDLLERQLDRKEFLIFLGTAFITIIGITNLADTVTKIIAPPKAKNGFGSGPYGG